MSAGRFIRAVLWTLVALAVVGHAVGGWLYSSRIIDEEFTPAPQAVEVPSGDHGLNETSYQSALGSMDAWHLPSTGTTWVIHVHGLNATPAEAEGLFLQLQQGGYPQLAITYRNDSGQPPDPSGFHRFGATEWEDIAAAADFARENGAERLVFVGYGAGASHALAYVYRHNLDDLAGVITDSANIDLGSTIEFRGGQENLPVIPVRVPKTITWVAKFFTSLRINVNWKAIDYIDRAERSLRVPVLAIHGTADGSAPIEQSIALSEVQPDLVRLAAFDGAGHLGSLEADLDRYLDEVLGFLDQVS